MAERRESTHVIVLTVLLGVAAGCAASPGLAPMRGSLGRGVPERPGSVLVADAPMSQLLRGAWHSKVKCPLPTPPPTPTPAVGVGPTTSLGTLFVSEHSSNKAPIVEFDASGLNHKPLGTIPSGSFIRGAEGLWVDGSGTLYVANYGYSSIAEYPQGSMNANVLTNPAYMFQPIDVAVDSKANTWVVDGNGGPVLIFPPGPQPTPTPAPTVLTGFFYATGVAFDTSGNAFVVDQLAGSSGEGDVIKIPPGSQKGTALGLKRLNFPVGIAIAPSNDIYVSNLGNSSLMEYGAGATTPKRAITNGICDPVYLALNTAGDVFVVNSGTSTVTGYHPGLHHPFTTLTTGMADPRGLAVNPNWQP